MIFLMNDLLFCRDATLCVSTEKNDFILKVCQFGRLFWLLHNSGTTPLQLVCTPIKIAKNKGLKLLYFDRIVILAAV
jgi:hypothetical protein